MHPGDRPARGASCLLPDRDYGRRRARRWARDDSIPLTRVLNLVRLARAVARLEGLRRRAR